MIIEQMKSTLLNEKRNAFANGRLIGKHFVAIHVPSNAGSDGSSKTTGRQNPAPTGVRRDFSYEAGRPKLCDCPNARK